MDDVLCNRAQWRKVQSTVEQRQSCSWKQRALPAAQVDSVSLLLECILQGYECSEDFLGYTGRCIDGMSLTKQEAPIDDRYKISLSNPTHCKHMNCVQLQYVATLHTVH